MVPKHSLLKYFTLTFTKHKSSKFQGSGPPLSFWGQAAFNQSQGQGWRRGGGVSQGSVE